MKNSMDEVCYEQLTIDERIQLTLAAFARNDETEIEKLYRTCEEKQYRQTCVEFSNKMDVLNSIRLTVLAMVQHYLHEADSYFLKSCAFQWMIEAYEQGVLSVSENVNEKSLVNQSIMDYKDRQTERIKEFDVSCAQYAVYIYSTYKGLRLFCDKVSIDFTQLLQWIDLERLYPDMEQFLIEPTFKLEDELVEFVYQNCMRLWGGD